MGLIYAKGVYLGVRTYELFFFFGFVSRFFVFFVTHVFYRFLHRG